MESLELPSTAMYDQAPVQRGGQRIPQPDFSLTEVIGSPPAWRFGW